MHPLTLGGELNDIIPCDNRASCQIFQPNSNDSLRPCLGQAIVRRPRASDVARVCPYCDFRQGRTNIHDEKAVSKSIA